MTYDETGNGALVVSGFGVIFDNDGVLVDSEGISAEAFIRAAAEQGVSVEHDSMERYCGLTDAAIAEDLASSGTGQLDLPRFEDRKRDLYFELAAAEPGVRAFSGVRPLIEQLRAAGIPVVVASSGSRQKVAFNLERAGLSSFFRLRVTGEDVVRGKPDPEVFLKAASLAGLEPSRCAVIEDSLNGLKAARAAGMLAVGVTTTFAADRLEPWADWVVSGLEEITVEGLSARLSAGHAVRREGPR